MKQTPITVTRPDFEHLKDLLDKTDTENLPYIDALLTEIERADVVESAEVANTVVTMNSAVLFANETVGSEHQLKLVYPADAGQSNTISVLAPIGCALLGLSVGQSIEREMPNGRKMRLRVKQVIDQPEVRLWHADEDEDKQARVKRKSKALDQRLEDTFPASDATAIYR